VTLAVRYPCQPCLFRDQDRFLGPRLLHGMCGNRTDHEARGMARQGWSSIRGACGGHSGRGMVRETAKWMRTEREIGHVETRTRPQDLTEALWRSNRQCRVNYWAEQRAWRVCGERCPTNFLEGMATMLRDCNLRGHMLGLRKHRFLIVTEMLWREIREGSTHSW
jgi:hypothetical protein